MRRIRGLLMRPGVLLRYRLEYYFDNVHVVSEADDLAGYIDPATLSRLRCVHVLNVSRL